MTTVTDALSGKSHGDENFPVASRLIAARHRPTILAYYRFARAADDVVDHPTLEAERKLALVDALERTLLGLEDTAEEALPLRAACAERGLDTRHGRDLLVAFRRDVIHPRTRDWMDLMDYCAFSAAPVGRFVLDVHGESRDLWPGNDALCAALQVINHLQDCGRDRRALDRVYVPLDLFARHGCDVAALDAPAASPELRRCLDELLDRTSGLLDRSEGFATGIRDVRLSFEVAVIHGLARRLVERLRREDPLATRVVAGKAAMLGTAARAAARHALARFGRRAPVLP